MTIRTYGNTSLHDYVNSDDPPINGGVTTTNPFGLTAVGSGLEISAIFPDITTVIDVNWVRTAILDFNEFPGIPSNALISRVTLEATVIGNCASISEAGASCTNTISSRVSFGAPGAEIYTEVISDTQSNLNTNINTILQIEHLFTPGNEITFNDLIANYTIVSIIGDLVSAGSGDGVATIDSDGSNAISAWSVEIEYTGGPFSWYIKSFEAIVNGQPVSIIESILAIGDGDDVPDDYVLYGPGPDEPEYLWWTSSNAYLYAINSPVSPGIEWVSSSDPPVCVGCLSLTLGILDILVANASGIYTLETDKLSETLYDREGETFDVKIPNPMAKHGFLP